MSKIEAAVQWAINIANDSAHGYDQGSRWGPDYDCSSLVISAWQQAGVPVKDRGATYTGNMLLAFLQAGFVKVTDGSLQRGDVLLNVKSHTALYIGSGQMVEAGGNEWGGITGGQTGDQTGWEIRVRGYYDFPWDYVLRYQEIDDATEDETQTEESVPVETVETWSRPTETMYAKLPLLQKWHCGPAVQSMQLQLGIEADGYFGADTDNAVREFQKKQGLLVDGEVGSETWAAMIGK